MKLRYIFAAIFTTAFCLNLGSYNIANANEPEHLCYFITHDNKVINLSNLCPTKKSQFRSKKNLGMSKVDTSTIRPPNFSHYPPSKFRENLRR